MIAWRVAALGAGRGLVCVVVPPARLLVAGRSSAPPPRTPPLYGYRPVVWAVCGRCPAATCCVTAVIGWA